jgi:hypothetical protein
VGGGGKGDVKSKTHGSNTLRYRQYRNCPGSSALLGEAPLPAPGKSKGAPPDNGRGTATTQPPTSCGDGPAKVAAGAVAAAMGAHRSCGCRWGCGVDHTAAGRAGATTILTPDPGPAWPRLPWVCRPSPSGATGSLAPSPSSRDSPARLWVRARDAARRGCGDTDRDRGVPGLRAVVSARTTATASCRLDAEEGHPLPAPTVNRVVEGPWLPLLLPLVVVDREGPRGESGRAWLEPVPCPDSSLPVAREGPREAGEATGTPGP